MGMNRREFLRLAGLSTLVGLGGKAAFELIAPGQVEAQSFAPDPKAWHAGQMGHGGGYAQAG